MAERKIIGYWIEESDAVVAKVAQEGRALVRIKMHHWPVLDGPIDTYLNNPRDFLVTPIYEKFQSQDDIDPGVVAHVKDMQDNGMFTATRMTEDEIKAHNLKFNPEK